jgi:hypothetical protein
MKVHELIALLKPYAEQEICISWDEQVWYSADTGEIETQEKPINAIFSTGTCILLSADCYQKGTAIWKDTPSSPSPPKERYPWPTQKAYRLMEVAGVDTFQELCQLAEGKQEILGICTCGNLQQIPSNMYNVKCDVCGRNEVMSCHSLHPFVY